jgi:hypothetical protein
VSRGYDRQAVAIGLVMLAMVAMRSLSGFACNMALATAMHQTALLLVPILVLGFPINNL